MWERNGLRGKAGSKTEEKGQSGKEVFMWKEEKEIVPFENKLWLSSPTMHGPELEYMTEAFRYETRMSTVGKNISEVEHLTCEKVGCGHAVALASGTAALHMAVKLAGVKPEKRCSVRI